MKAARKQSALIIRWFTLLVAFVCLACAPEPSPEHTVPRAPADGERLRIEQIKPVDAHPGQAIVVQYSGGHAAEAITASVDKRSAEVIEAAPGRVVIRIPHDAALGRVKLRLHEGDQSSKSRDVIVDSVSWAKVARNLLGGLALFLFGLRTLSRGFIGWAGQPTRLALSNWTGRLDRGLVVGALMGAVTQAITSAAALVSSLVEARLLRERAALVTLLGAHFGAAVVVLVLPLGINNEALWIVAIGVVWLSLARNRRHSAGGKILVGLGLVFYGLSLLRAGFGPLSTDPAMLERLDALQAEGILGSLARLGSGIALGGLLQGPGAAFGLVLGVCESTALLGVRDALQILGGANFGAALASLVITAPFGSRVRRLGLAHLGMSAVLTAVFLALTPLVEQVVDALIDGDPTEAVYGKRILFPWFGPHLGAGFALIQAISVALTAALLGPISRILQRSRDKPPELHARGSGVESTRVVLEGLAASRTILDAIMELLRTGERGRATVAESEFARTRAAMKETVAGLYTDRSEPWAIILRGAAAALLHVHTDLEKLQRIAERGIERDLEVSREQHEAFSNLDAGIRVGLGLAAQHLEGRGSIDMDRLQDAEIRLNAAEAALRRSWLRAISEQPAHERSLVWALEVIAAYESVGNQVYRLASVLADDDPD